MNILVYGLEALGLFAVGLCFMFLLPGVGAVLATLFSFILGEQTYARLQNQESGTEMNLDEETPISA
ncbi:MAG: hypothetical protein AAFV53_02325 [Myxococcota bacterium]